MSAGVCGHSYGIKAFMEGIEYFHLYFEGNLACVDEVEALATPLIERIHQGMDAPLYLLVDATNVAAIDLPSIHKWIEVLESCSERLNVIGEFVAVCCPSVIVRGLLLIGLYIRPVPNVLICASAEEALSALRVRLSG